MKVFVLYSELIMEDSNPTQNHNGQLGPSSGGINGNKRNDDPNQQIKYSIPGILHFIQHEWIRFETERAQWDVDRAEMQARIAFLQGERKGQESLKNDLVRRIKMLEYALKQERAKFYKLKYGTEYNQGDMKPPTIEENTSVPPEVNADSDAPFSSVSNITWKQGRQLLRQYLHEIGYTDSIIDVRSNRVRSLLGLNNNEENNAGGGNAVNGNVSSGRGNPPRTVNNSQGRNSYPTTSRKNPQTNATESMLLETEASVMVNFEFLGQTDVDLDEEVDMNDDMDESNDAEDQEDLVNNAKRKKGLLMNETDDDDEMTTDEEVNEALKELNIFPDSDDTNDISSNTGRSQGDHTDWGRNLLSSMGVVPPSNRPNANVKEDNMDSTLGLGELAQLTVNNEAEAAYDMPKEALRKTWNAKYTLRSHFDGVRALAFHPQESVLITASEDHTLKLWNLQKTVPAKKSASLDVEPLYTFRCHTGPVLCLAMNSTGEQCYSGATDGIIHCWNLPNANVDPYDSFDPSVLACSLTGHTDSVWGLSILYNNLLSCSADGTVKLWAPNSNTKKVSALSTYTSEQDGVPTSVDFAKDEANRMVAAYNSAHCVLFDLETTKPVTRLESSQEVVNNVLGRQINKVVCHPTLPLTMTAHEDRHIRFFDNLTGKLVHSMVAHLDAVTSLAVDPNGLYLLSGSHDCSIRLWNLDNKTCVQEITAHRKKFDEAILDVAFHPSQPYIASAGADGLAKVFV